MPTRRACGPAAHFRMICGLPSWPGATKGRINRPGKGVPTPLTPPPHNWAGSRTPQTPLSNRFAESSTKVSGMPHGTSPLFSMGGPQKTIAIFRAWVVPEKIVFVSYPRSGGVRGGRQPSPRAVNLSFGSAGPISSNPWVRRINTSTRHIHISSN